MSYIFFYSSALVIWIVFAIVSRLVPLDIRSLIVGIGTAAYSVIFDTVWGEINGLYYYVSPRESLTYIILAAVLIYPFVNILYTLFLPNNVRSQLYYSLLWIGAMLLFEYISIKTGTIVFTGWRPIPWSIVTYIITYTWIYFLYTQSTKQFSLRSQR